MSRLARAIFAASGLAVVLALAALAVGGGEVSEAAAEERPNVVLIMSDDQFTNTTGRASMPYVGSRKDWTKFRNAMVNTALCCPSRATALTGQTSSHHGIESNSETELFKDHPTIANWLDDAGYQTGFTGKYLNEFPWNEAPNYIPTGWDWWAGYSGQQTYNNFTLNENGALVEYTGRGNNSIDVISDQAIEYLDTVDPSQPFFQFVSFNAPHAPSLPPRRYEDAQVNPIPETEAFLEQDVSDKPRWIRNAQIPSAEELRAKRTQHQRALLAIDDGVERIFGKLSTMGELGDTLVIYTTDHGVSMGEHNYVKKTCGYEVCSNVPLLIRGPGTKPGNVRSLVGNIDLTPTIADYADIPTGEKVDGSSMRPLLERTARGLHKGLFLARAQGQSNKVFYGLRTKNWKYIDYRRTGEAELYDLARDPYELFNLLSTKRDVWKEKAADLEKRMLEVKRTKPVYLGPDGQPERRGARPRD
jgi:N-acetylglucosamine-6-sulfatase